MKTLFTVAVCMLFAIAAQGQSRLVRILDQLRDRTNTLWNDSSEHIYNYNTQGQITEEYVNTYYAQLSAWRPQMKQVNSFNAAGLLSHGDRFDWNNADSAWETTPFSFFDYRYNSSSMVEVLTWDNANHTNMGKDSLVYNADGLLAETINNLGTIFYTYNTAGQRTETLYKSRQGGVLVNYIRIFSTYNSAGQLVRENQEYYSNNTWVSTNYRYVFSYNADGTTDIILTEYTYNGNWYQVARTLHFYTAATGIAKTNSDNSFTVYPNPSNGVFTVDAGFDGPAKITVYDVAGKQVLCQPATGAQTQLNLSGMAKGIYVLHLQTNGGVQTRKLYVE
jgi:YD repeat-containing protein